MHTETLARHIVETDLQHLPKEALNEARRSFLNWLGVAVGGARHPAVEKALQVVRLFSREPQASVMGRPVKVDMWSAALLNGLSSHVFDFDDTLLETVLHPSAPIYPAILAYAEHEGLDGYAVLASFVLGCEVAARVARMLYPSHYERGWHITGTAGAIGAAAAVGKLMELDVERMTYAIGLAASQPTGLREMFGTMTKPFHPGKAAANGLFSALLAREGFTSSRAALEGKRGYGPVLSEEPDFAALHQQWGDSWLVTENSYKPFACGIVMHPAIDGMIRMRQYGFVPEQIAEVRLFVHPLVLELTGKQEPKNGLEAKFSVYHGAAVGFLDGKAGERQFSSERVNHSDVVQLRRKVHAEIDPQLDADQARIVLRTTDGGTYEVFVEHAVGSKMRPMTDEELKDKFCDLTQDVLSADALQQIFQLVDELQGLKDIRTLTQNVMDAVSSR